MGEDILRKIPRAILSCFCLGATPVCIPATLGVHPRTFWTLFRRIPRGRKTLRRGPQGGNAGLAEQWLSNPFVYSRAHTKSGVFRYLFFFKKRTSTQKLSQVLVVIAYPCTVVCSSPHKAREGQGSKGLAKEARRFGNILGAAVREESGVLHTTPQLYLYTCMHICIAMPLCSICWESLGWRPMESTAVSSTQGLVASFLIDTWAGLGWRPNCIGVH